MSAQAEPTQQNAVHLNDDDVAHLMNVLRNSSQPVTTQQLIDVLRRQAGEPRGEDSANVQKERD
jgi:hypothetical protein